MALGLMIKLTDTEHFSMLTEISMRENGLRIRQMEKVSILMQMERHITVNGKMINNTALVLKDGQMEQSMKGIIVKERKMKKEN